MKRVITVMILALLIAVPMFGQIQYSDLESSFATFADDVAEALPFAAAATGLTWSDARVKGFPHFGIGLSVSAVTIPKEAFEDVATALGFELPSEITDSSLGVPLPGYAVDARLGLPFIPFDIGAKFGYLTPSMGDALEGSTGLTAEYILAGLQVRYPLLKDRLLIPAVSVGLGYTYLNGSVAMETTGMANQIDFPGGETLNIGNPDAVFAWKTHAIDLSVQASKSLLILTPYLGAGYSYGWSRAGGGVNADITGDVDAVEDNYDVEITDDGFVVYSDASGGSFRAFGGLSFNLTILKLDLNAQYNFTTQSLGGGLNARIQI
ncbi:DUF6588 family protein [Sediminispirochaeta smaragdinae]|uniref:Uncharacterized protein n=1 Tax=Sediminispirochaeta smaragdinae (strain DSM 11293 / JCM 15392 / SEBR 4228) TaxID=573413 RepID=E1R6P7_SEDSS|nr:DUF6588 family protein [Sediminispirochaeta smaragdinae]ADK79179.1 hypothetical protein Spirs_0019 [Sediminispirochaeta smaragdinae DSM 11293]